MSKIPASQLANRNLSKPVFHVYVVENTTDGGRYVSVRKNISATAFWNLLCSGARDPNFDQPIHNSIRKMRDEMRYLEDSHHKITRVDTFTTKVEAQKVAAQMIENNANKARAYNATRPSVGATEGWRWYSEAEVKDAKKMARKVSKPASKTVEQPSA